MGKEYKVRVHFAEMSTRFGVDKAFVFDDPKHPTKKSGVIKALREKLDFKPSKRKDIDGNGFYGGDEDTPACFEYAGFEDYVLPESLVKRIQDDADGKFSWEPVRKGSAGEKVGGAEK